MVLLWSASQGGGAEGMPCVKRVAGRRPVVVVVSNGEKQGKKSVWRGVKGGGGGGGGGVK